MVAISGYGDPAGDINPVLSLRRFREPIERLSGAPTIFVPDCVGPIAEAHLARVPMGSVALMENVRFHAETRRQTRSFAIRLSALGDHFLVTGALPKSPAAWIAALGELLPQPPAAPGES